MKTILTIIYFSALTLLSTVAVANKGYNWEITQAEKPKIIVTDTVVRESLPDSFLGLNVNYRKLQEHIWDVSGKQLKSGIDDKLQKFGNIWYRYPGGIVANSFDWTQAIGDVSKRGKQKTPYSEKQEKAIFGIDEYLQLLNRYDANSFYVLNLVGLDPLEPKKEFDKDEVALKNQQLAEYLLEHNPSSSPLHYYQLGNELDRFKYEWVPEKYIERSLATINAISEVDDQAQFVAFLRDFKWKYKKDPSLGVSSYDDFMRQVMEGLPMVKDYSLHHYSDGKREDGKSRVVPFWLKLMQRSIETYESIRNESPRIWITEHARQKSSNQPGSDGTKFFSNNLNGAITTSDYLTALAQVPEVQGTFRHGLNAGPWQLFDYNYKHGDLRPLPIYWAMRMLRAMPMDVVLKTENFSSVNSQYKGGYDTRAVGFTDAQGEQLGLWAVNRHNQPLEVDLSYMSMAGKKMDYCHYSMSGKHDGDADDFDLDPKLKLEPESLVLSFTDAGETQITLPPSSVSTFIIGDNLSCEPIN